MIASGVSNKANSASSTMNQQPSSAKPQNNNTSILSTSNVQHNWPRTWKTLNPPMPESPNTPLSPLSTNPTSMPSKISTHPPSTADAINHESPPALVAPDATSKLPQKKLSQPSATYTEEKPPDSLRLSRHLHGVAGKSRK
jgi:hypothetical protein